MEYPSDNLEYEEDSYREFFTSCEQLSSEDHKISIQDTNSSLTMLRDDIIGSYTEFHGPFGEKFLVYSDWTASGRSLGTNLFVVYGQCN